MAMKLLLKQKVFTFNPQYVVYNEDNVKVYDCKAKFWSIGKKINVFNEAKEKIIYIKQRLFRFRKRYDIYLNGERWTTIIKKITMFKAKFKFTNLDWSTEGNFIQHNYTVSDDLFEIMSVNKRYISLGDVYELLIHEPDNALKCLAIALVVDISCHEKRKKRK